MIAKLRAEEAPPAAEASSPGPSPRSRIIAILALGAFLNYFVSYGFYFWFPTMLKRQSGLSDVLVGLIGTVPYAVLFVAMLVNRWHSDRRMERRWHAAVPCLLAAIGAVGLTGHPQSLSIAVVLYTLLAITPAALPPRLSYSSRCRERTSVNRAQRAESRTEPPNWGCLRSH